MKREIGNRTIIKYAAIAMGTGAIPVPGVDIAAVTGIQIKMLDELSRLFDVEFSKDNTKSLLTALTGGIAARLVGSAIKIIPGVGTLVGGVASMIASGASTYATGQVFLNHFLMGGTLDDFDPMAFKQLYKIKLDEGKKIMINIKTKTKLEANDVTKIKDLIGSGKTKEALQFFSHQIKGKDIKSHSELIVHMASFNELESNSRLGIIEEKQQNIERNKINHKVLELLDSCSKKTLDNDSTK